MKAGIYEREEGGMDLIVYKILCNCPQRKGEHGHWLCADWDGVRPRSSAGTPCKAYLKGTRYKGPVPENWEGR